jgi:DNA gyrase subunit A
VTRRRTNNRLGKKKARLHLVEGLLIAIVAIDEVIQVIRSSEEVDEARSRLMQIFELSEIQAEYILELRLRRLTKFSRIELETEKTQLEDEIRALERILSNDAELRDVVSDELAQVADKYGDDRRTLLMDESEVVRSVPASRSTAVSAELADSATTVLLTVTGLMGRVAEMPAPGSKRKKHDVFSHRIDTTTRTDIGAVTSAGRMIRVHVGDIPDAGGALEASAMVRASEFFGLTASETLVGVIELVDTNEIALATAQGTVKRVLADYPAKEQFDLIALKEGDQVISAVLANSAKEYVIVTSDAQVLRFSADSVRAQGRAASGVSGINLSDGAKVIAFASVESSADAFVVTAANSSAALAGTDAGSIKLSPLEEFPAKGRATGGVRGQKLLRNEDQLYFAAVTSASPAASATDGKPLELPEPAKRDASGSTAGAAISGAGFLLS